MRPSDANEHITLTGPFGTIHIDGSNLIADIIGNISLKAGGAITATQGGQLTNKGKNIGFDHRHTYVVAGGDQTRVPV